MGQRKYEKAYNVQAGKLAKEIGAGKAAQELGIPVDTLYGWRKAASGGAEYPCTAGFWSSAGRAFTGICASGPALEVPGAGGGHAGSLLKRDFRTDKPLEKCVTDITGIKAKDGKLYISAMFVCFDLTVTRT